MSLHLLFDIATRYSGKVALAIADDQPANKVRGVAHLFDLGSKAQLQRFSVRYERCGPRLALSRDDRLCFVGCYCTYGVAAYSAEDGGEVWRRKDLKSVQSVRASELQDWVFCGRENGDAHLLDATTGNTLEKFSGIKDAYPSPFCDAAIVAGRSLELHAPFGHKLASFKRTGDYELECAFSPSEFVLNEPDRLRCYDLKTCEPLWTFETTGAQISRLWFSEIARVFVGLPSRSSSLLFVEPRAGKVVRQLRFNAELGAVFGRCGRGSEMLAASLQLYSVQTGALLADLATQELIAWDPTARTERFRELATSGRSAHELERYMVSEGFANHDIDRVLMMQQLHEMKKRALGD